jgi:hypothetical protein
VIPERDIRHDRRGNWIVQIQARNRKRPILPRKTSLSCVYIRPSGQGRDRTGDTGIFSPVLYQLSYLSAGRSRDGNHLI